jgi:hypothetical protein
VLLGHLTDDRQTEARALLTANVRAAEEAIEDVWQVSLLDAGAVVANANARGIYVHLDGSAWRRVAGGVVEQIVDRTLEPGRHAFDADGLRPQLETQAGGVSTRAGN